MKKEELLQNRKQDTEIRLCHLTIHELINEVALAAGDDWDGCFTTFGSWEFEYAKKLLHRKISELETIITELAGVRDAARAVLFQDAYKDEHEALKRKIKRLSPEAKDWPSEKDGE